ncbi:MAG TPA: sulfite exporter TauE/SafE family protein [Planctomycetes bacterium]|nr:sulfite exporter TauE/SafE family protein [Planctomycetota bacterium]
MLWLVITLIFLLGSLFAMLGLGGALLYIPVFHWFGYDFKSVAIPTGLFLNGLTALSAAASYHRSKMIDYRGGLPMVVTSFLGAPIGAWASRYVPQETLILLFSVGMLVAGAKMLLSSGNPEPASLLAPHKRAWITGSAGLVIGFLAGLLGIGGGFLFVPILIHLGYPAKQAAATSSFVVIFSSFSGFAGHLSEGHFDLPLLIGAGVAVLIASQLGAHLMKHKMKAKWLKQMFGLLLVGVAIKLALGILLRG